MIAQIFKNTTFYRTCTLFETIKFKFISKWFVIAKLINFQSANEMQIRLHHNSDTSNAFPHHEDQCFAYVHGFA